MNTLPRRRSRRRTLRAHGATPTRFPSRESFRTRPSTIRSDADRLPQPQPQTDTRVDVKETPQWKRALDLAFVILFLPFALLLGVAVACWIRLVSPGSVLFRQMRIGQGGRPFTIYKFRSMRFQVGTEVHENYVEDLIRSNRSMTKLDCMGDSRLIPGGCFLRATGLDELPQFLNVLRGEMSFVGPRPCVSREYELHSAAQRERFSVLPGITGLWQVKRDASTTFSDMVEMDSSYARSQSLGADLSIIARTPTSLCRQIARCFRQRSADVTGVEGLSGGLGLGEPPVRHPGR